MRKYIYAATTKVHSFGQENKVCKLIRSLYNLKQYVKSWYEKFHKTILSFGFIVNRSYSCVYSKVIDDNYVKICFYDDDISIFNAHIDAINETKKFICSQFDMKDLGEANVILGVKVSKTTNGFSLSQLHYVEKLLTKFNNIDEKHANDPYDFSIRLKKN